MIPSILQISVFSGKGREQKGTEGKGREGKQGTKKERSKLFFLLKKGKQAKTKTRGLLSNILSFEA